MAIITMTTTTDNDPVRLPLPDEASITVTNTCTGAIAYTLHVTDAGMLIIDDAAASDSAASHTTVSDNAMSETDASDTEAPVVTATASDTTDVAEPEAAAEVEVEPVTDTTTVADTTNTAATQFTGVLDADRVCVDITYDADRAELVNDADGRAIDEADLADLMRLAQRYNAGMSMTFDTPNHGMTTFTGHLHTDYQGIDGTVHEGVVLLGAQGGAQVFNVDGTLADDMRVVREIDIRFAAEDARSDDNIVISTPDDDTDADDDDDAEAESEDDTDADAGNTAAAQKMYVTMWARSHINAESWVDIAHYAVQHDLAVKANIFDYDTTTAQGVYTGRLTAEHGDGYTFVLVDDVHGRAPIDLFPGSVRAGFTWLTVFSDTTIDTADAANIGDSAYIQTTPRVLLEHFHEHFGALDTTDLAIGDGAATLDEGDVDTDDTDTDSTVANTDKVCATLRAGNPTSLYLWNTIATYAQRHELSVLAHIYDESADEGTDVYVGKLDEGYDFYGIYTLADKSKGDRTIDLSISAKTRGFVTLTVFSDDKMRRQGFRGTNDADYTEVSVAQLLDHLRERFDADTAGADDENT